MPSHYCTDEGEPFPDEFWRGVTRYERANLQLADRRPSVEYLRSLSYREYLLSDWWQVRRADAIRDARSQCEDCGRRPPAVRSLDVHHRTYDRLGCEERADLVCLCRPCHSLRHGGAS